MSKGRLDALERFSSPLEAPHPSFDSFLRRRDRKRRNQRIAAAVVAIAVFVAPVAWLAATGERAGRTSAPVSNGPSITNDALDPVGLVGLAPEGAKPSSPTRGELVVSFMFGHTMGDPGRFSLDLYADGRLIWQRLGDPTGAGGDTTGLLEQRLTPEGVALMRAEVVSTGLVDHDLHLENALGLNFGQIEVREGGRLIRVTWGDMGPDGGTRTMPTQEQTDALRQLDARLEDPASWLPASAWEDAEITAFVPARYSVCYEAIQGVGLPGVLASLPRRAEDMLRTWERTHSEVSQRYPDESLDIWCSHVTIEEARALARVLGDSGVGEADEDVFGLTYVFAQRRPGTTEVTLSFEPLLPHQT